MTRRRLNFNQWQGFILDQSDLPRRRLVILLILKVKNFRTATRGLGNALLRRMASKPKDNLAYEEKQCQFRKSPYLAV
jgi:hypothetical protein